MVVVGVELLSGSTTFARVTVQSKLFASQGNSTSSTSSSPSAESTGHQAPVRWMRDGISWGRIVVSVTRSDGRAEEEEEDDEEVADAVVVAAAKRVEEGDEEEDEEEIGG